VLGCGAYGELFWGVWPGEGDVKGEEDMPGDCWVWSVPCLANGLVGERLSGEAIVGLLRSFGSAVVLDIIELRNGFVDCGCRGSAAELGLLNCCCAGEDEKLATPF